MSFIGAFARMLGVADDDAEEVLRSERAAKHVLSRRSFFGLSAAMAGATAFSFAAPAAVAELPGPFFGVDRSAGPQFLSGLRVPPVRTESILKRLYREEAMLFDDPYLKAIRRESLGVAQWLPSP